MTCAVGTCGGREQLNGFDKIQKRFAAPLKNITLQIILEWLCQYNCSLPAAQLNKSFSLQHLSLIHILGGSVDTDVTRIALRHHEKLDGSGYPKGITGKDMTLEEEIVAVSDIVSALLGTRSYKEAFSKERTLSIIQEMANDGKLNPAIISVIQENFDEIVDEVAENCSPALENYYGIQLEYRRLLTRYLE